MPRTIHPLAQRIGVAIQQAAKYLGYAPNRQVFLVNKRNCILDLIND